MLKMNKYYSAHVVKFVYKLTVIYIYRNGRCSRFKLPADHLSLADLSVRLN